MDDEFTKQIEVPGTNDPKLLEILKHFEREENAYLVCSELEAALFNAGYTIDWGLDAEPFDLKSINIRG